MAERILQIGSHPFTEVKSEDEKGPGGAYHHYAIDTMPDGKGICTNVGYIYFQKGPVQENGVNGCFMEDLLVICIDRLKCFQASDFACRENALALTKLQEAMHWLNHRTADRQARGVEGKTVA